MARQYPVTELVGAIGIVELRVAKDAHSQQGIECMSAEETAHIVGENPASHRDGNDDFCRLMDEECQAAPNRQHRRRHAPAVKMH